jgi:hypothetical protein
MICLSQRDDADDVGRGFSERYKGDAPLNHANPDPSLLPIVFTHIRTNKKKTSKHLFCIGEVETMLPDVGSILCIVSKNARSWPAFTPLQPIQDVTR